MCCVLTFHWIIAEHMAFALCSQPHCFSVVPGMISSLRIQITISSIFLSATSARRVEMAAVMHLICEVLPLVDVLL